jgi:adenylate kinase family enzyme
MRIRSGALTDGEIVLFVGYPAAGKSTLAARFLERGYELLNRDLEGGGLSKLREELDRRLSRGVRRLVLDPVLASRLVDARVDREERKGKQPSDHAPVILDFLDQRESGKLSNLSPLC